VNQSSNHYYSNKLLMCSHTALIVILAVVFGIVLIGIIAWIVVIVKWKRGSKTFFLSYRPMKTPDDGPVST
jgi:predicted tellurium resistance membrane protein TerC